MTYRSLDTSERKYDFQHSYQIIDILLVIRKMISYIKNGKYIVTQPTYNSCLVYSILELNIPNLYPQTTQYNILTIYNNSLSLEFHTRIGWNRYWKISSFVIDHQL